MLHHHHHHHHDYHHHENISHLKSHQIFRLDLELTRKMALLASYLNWGGFKTFFLIVIIFIHHYRCQLRYVTLSFKIFTPHHFVIKKLHLLVLLHKVKTC